jgi:hypothetical protein
MLNCMIVGVAGSSAILSHPDSSEQITKFHNKNVQMGDHETSKFRETKTYFDFHRVCVVRLCNSFRSHSRSTRQKFMYSLY